MFGYSFMIVLDVIMKPYRNDYMSFLISSQSNYEKVEIWISLNFTLDSLDTKYCDLIKI